MTVFFAAPVIRQVARTLLPSTRQPMICARLSVLKRFILTIMLEGSDGTDSKERETPLASADSTVIIADMPSAHDVARYILEQKDPMDTWKLQKLVYYSQAWHLVWDSEPLFDEPIQAWTNGPVVPALFRVHSGKFKMEAWPKGDVSRLTNAQRESIDVVLKSYGRRTGFALRELTHKEPPWKKARRGLDAGARSNAEITHDAMASYYGSL
jgi:uncharacterized phage-associated protein